MSRRMEWKRNGHELNDYGCETETVQDTKHGYYDEHGRIFARELRIIWYVDIKFNLLSLD